MFTSDLRWRFIGKSQNPLEAGGSHTCSVEKCRNNDTVYTTRSYANHVWIQQFNTRLHEELRKRSENMIKIGMISVSQVPCCKHLLSQ